MKIRRFLQIENLFSQQRGKKNTRRYFSTFSCNIEYINLMQNEKERELVYDEI